MAAPFDVAVDDDVVLVRPSGDVDLTTADSLRSGCLAAMTNDCVGLVVDLSASSYLDSAGIRAFFSIAERLEPHRQRLALVVPAGAHFRRVLAIVDMETSATVDETVEDALDRLRSPARPRA